MPIAYFIRTDPVAAALPRATQATSILDLSSHSLGASGDLTPPNDKTMPSVDSNMRDVTSALILETLSLALYLPLEYVYKVSN